MTTIEKLKIMLEAPTSTSIVAYRTFLKDILKESEKYRWHDLRKNPDDLPEDEQRVLFFTRPYDGEEEYGVRYWSGEYFDYYKEFCNDDCEGCVTYRTYKKEDVIAWREIEPFEGE